MKRFSLLPLVALAFAVACTDATTAPANSHTLLAPNDPALKGDAPPPPIDAAIELIISSDPVYTVVFSGVYFSQGKTAWLRLDNGQSVLFGTSASSNARFKKSDDRLSGMGTLMFGTHVVTIEDVTFFFANPDCGITGDACAIIEFDATLDGQSGHHGTAIAINRDLCNFGDGVRCPFPEGTPE